MTIKIWNIIRYFVIFIITRGGFIFYYLLEKCLPKWPPKNSIKFDCIKPFNLSGNTINQIDHFNYYAGLFDLRSISRIKTYFSSLTQLSDITFIGANSGTYTIYLKNLFEKFVCYEPHPETYRALLLNLENNQLLGRTELYLEAVDTRNVRGSALLYPVPNSLGSSSLLNFHPLATDPIEIKTVPARDLIRTKVFFIDAEGLDVEILTQLVKINVDSIFVFEVDNKKSQEDLNQFIYLHYPIGWQIYELVKCWRINTSLAKKICSLFFYHKFSIVEVNQAKMGPMLICMNKSNTGLIENFL